MAAIFFYLPQAFISKAWHLVLLQALCGLANGGMIPSLGALMNSRSPVGGQGAVYGLNASVNAAGRSLAPMMGAGMAIWLGMRSVFILAAIRNSGQRDGIHIDDFQVNWELPTSVSDNDQSIPYRFSLSQNYPNPFNPSTLVKFTLAERGNVNLDIYDMLGRKVKTLVSGTLESGEHEIIWNSIDESGDEVASGIYLYKLVSGGFTLVKRMTLLR